VRNPARTVMGIDLLAGHTLQSRVAAKEDTNSCRTITESRLRSPFTKVAHQAEVARLLMFQKRYWRIAVSHCSR
jgi:hypothetical protein